MIVVSQDFSGTDLTIELLDQWSQYGGQPTWLDLLGAVLSRFQTIQQSASLIHHILFHPMRPQELLGLRAGKRTSLHVELVADVLPQTPGG